MAEGTRAGGVCAGACVRGWYVGVICRTGIHVSCHRGVRSPLYRKAAVGRSSSRCGGDEMEMRRAERGLQRGGVLWREGGCDGGGNGGRRQRQRRRRACSHSGGNECFDGTCLAICSKTCDDILWTDISSSSSSSSGSAQRRKTCATRGERRSQRRRRRRQVGRTGGRAVSPARRAERRACACRSVSACWPPPCRRG